MAGAGRAPQENRVRRAEPARGDWTYAEAVGWRHGRKPACPKGLEEASREAWRTWMGAWFAWFWTPEDLPGLRQLIRLYDQVERGEFQRMNELRLQMDTYGITPKGQQDRRWKPPREEAPGVVSGPARRPKSRYAHLKAVPNDAVERT